MSVAYATPLRLEFSASRRLAAVLAVSHGGGLLLLPFTGLAAPVALGLGLLLCAAGWHAWRGCSALPSGSFVPGLVWGRNARVDLDLADGRRTVTRLQSSAFVTPWLVILELRDGDGRSRHLPVLPDMLPADQFRRLRVRLQLELARAGRDGR